MWRKLPTTNVLKRKGHLLRNPSDDQTRGIFTALLRKTRVELWTIQDLDKTYTGVLDPALKELVWPKRPVEIIDKIILGATDSLTIDAFKMFGYDTDTDNLITPGKSLPGIAYHAFINTSGLIEKVSNYDNVVYHTPGRNFCSIGVVLQYVVTDNSSEPTQKVMTSLIRLLTILCVQFKLNPHKAIKGQAEASVRFPFFKGHRNIKGAPGQLLSLDNLRYQVAIKMQKKLRYAGLYGGEINGKFNNATKVALNDFRSEAVELLYNKIKIEKIK